jgi:hypothetical protein
VTNAAASRDVRLIDGGVTLFMSKFYVCIMEDR